MKWTDKTKREYVRRLVEFYKVPLRLGEWNIDTWFGWWEDPDADDGVGKADCSAKPIYKEAFLRFNVKKIPTKDLKSYVIHEMIHPHVWSLSARAESLSKGDPEMLKVISELEESLTTTIEQILLPLLPDLPAEESK